jgi:hypothetical protein
MLSGGVLIIGSLIWDRENENRIRWRNDFLDQAGQIKVPAPIRYGRVSSGRCCTFSMVFSDECNRPELKGTAILVPFANNPVDLRMLKAHTSQLMKAERNKVDLGENVFKLPQYPFESLSKASPTLPKKLTLPPLLLS